MTTPLRKGMIKAIKIDEESEKRISSQKSGESDVDYSRRVYAEKRAYWNSDKPEVKQVIDKPIPTRTGEVNCRFYYNGDEASPVLFYIHGGGFVVGSIDTHDRIQRLHANHGHCNVVAIDYSKSPEVKCPYALHEVIDVIDYCNDNAKDLGLCADKFSVGGDSAGGHLSLATLLHFRDSGKVKFRSGLLYYGTFGLVDSPSMRLYGKAEFGLSWDVTQSYKAAYLAEGSSAYYSEYNLLGCNLNGLPPMLIAGLALDPLRDDSRLLAELLNQVGGIYKFSEYDGILHGCMHYSKVLPEAYLLISEGLSFMWSQLRDYD